jgi:hypothetical protein
MAVSEVVLFGQLSDENNYSTFRYLGRKESNEKRPSWIFAHPTPCF